VDLVLTAPAPNEYEDNSTTVIQHVQYISAGIVLKSDSKSVALNIPGWMQGHIEILKQKRTFR
jgi:hypothetical protein